METRRKTTIDLHEFFELAEDLFLGVDHEDKDGGRANVVDVIGRLADGVHRIADALEKR